MAGFLSDSYYNDPCFVSWQAKVDDGVSNYMVDPKAVLPTGIPQAFLATRGSTPSFYGPMNTPLVHRESLMQGRNQPLSKCPADDIVKNYGGTSSYRQPSCYRSDLEPSFDHTARSCTSLTELDIWSYTSFPEARYQNYIGISDLSCAFAQERLPVDLPQDPNRKSYGSYGATKMYI